VSLTQAKEAAEKTLADKPATPAYPDLSGKVHELETALAAAGATQAELQGKLDGATTALQKTAKSQNPDEQVQLRRERDELAGRVTALAGEIAQLRLDRERMQKMLADAGQQMRDATAATARIKELETQVTGLTKAKDDTAAQAAALQADLAAKGAAPAYPDLSGKVHDLEAQVGSLQATLAAKPAAPVTPDLSGRVSELESALAEAKRQLAAEPAKPAPGPAVDAAGLQKQLAEAEDKLAISLRGYSLLEKERDDLAAQAGKSAEGVTAERDTLATQVAALTAEVARLKSGAAVQADALTQTAALAAERNSLAARVADAEGRVAAAQAESARAGQALADLQRSTAQGSAELAAVRTQARQLQGSNTVLAGENYQLKTMLARTAGTPAPVVAAPAAVAPAGRTHVVAGGDSLSRLSQRYYGTAGRWQEIYNANRDKISNDGALRIGTELRIP
jgi:nucleoid-associated protein YgaU